MAKILITGAAGFIGSHLSEALIAGGHDVFGIDNFDPFYDRRIKEANLAGLLSSPAFTFREADITDKKAFGGFPADCDVVIHLAAKAGVRPSIDDPDGYLRTNVEGTQNLMNWMVRSGINKLLFASSSSVYGNNRKIPFAETDNVDFPISPYAYTKKAAELLIHTFHHLYGMSAFCLRFFTVYGPRQRPDLAIHKFTRMIRRGEALTMFGDGSTSRDYTFVADTVAGVSRALDLLLREENPRYEIINLGNNAPVALKDLIARLFEATGQTVPVRQLDMQPGDVDITYADIAKAEKLLGYRPATDIRTGLKAFVDWYDANLA